MQIQVLDVDAQVAFTTRIVLYQFSRNHINCPWFYPNQLLKSPAIIIWPRRETKFSAEKPATETPPS